jgi:hypothetical protein
MTDNFGKRNRREVTKPARETSNAVKVRKQANPVTQSGRSRFYIVVGTALLVLIVAGYALAV